MLRQPLTLLSKIGLGGGQHQQGRGNDNSSNDMPSDPTTMYGGRDSSMQLGASIGGTFQELKFQNPQKLEEDAIRRAIELSLLDCALVCRNGRQQLSQAALLPQPAHIILGVSSDASISEIKAAYRRMALETHPDKKGGSRERFEVVAKAYRALLNKNRGGDNENSSSVNNNGSCSSFATFDMTGEGSNMIKNTSHWDNELRDHRELVDDMFRNHGVNTLDLVSKQLSVLKALGLREKDAGATNRNENNQLIHNSCFYLSLAMSYLSGVGAYQIIDKLHNNNEIQPQYHFDSAGTIATNDPSITHILEEADKSLTSETALQLKRAIETQVVSAHPEWAEQGMVGEEVQAFSDFLVYVLDSSMLLSEWAVAVFDTVSGYVDIYKGKNYPDDTNANDSYYTRANTLTLQYVPGHYQPLLPVHTTSTAQAQAQAQQLLRPTLDELISALDKAGVFYVVTDGSA